MQENTREERTTLTSKVNKLETSESRALLKMESKHSSIP